MSTAYLRKIDPARDKLVELSNRLNESNNDLAHNVRYELLEIDDLLLHPFQTVPKVHFVHVTTSICDPEGNAGTAYCDEIIEFEREISAAFLYVALSKYIFDYREGYHIQISLQQLEDWLNLQKAHFKSVKRGDSPFTDETGLTIGNFKTDYGSIDFFLEYGLDIED